MCQLKINNWFLLFLLLLPRLSLSQNDPLANILAQQSSQVKEWLINNEVQLIYTQIDRDEYNKADFNYFKYGVDASRYFYPASSVKLPIAVLALEKLNQLNIKGLDAHSIMVMDSLPSTFEFTDSLQTTVANCIEKIFTVSDNTAFNVLYDFLGQEYIGNKLLAKGYDSARILHRLSIFGIDNRYSRPISFYNGDTLLYFQNTGYSSFSNNLLLKNEVRGKAHINQSDELVQSPFDFSKKNFVSIEDLNNMLLAVMFPDAIPVEQRFDISNADYELLYKLMCKLPKDSELITETKPDNYVKFWSYGDKEDGTIPDHIRIYNKVGWAYGFLTDVAYVVDTHSKIEYMLTAVIHVNENETYNDGVYEYLEVGLPFFGMLGRDIHNFEIQRPRKYLPDFGRLID